MKSVQSQNRLRYGAGAEKRKLKSERKAFRPDATLKLGLIR